MTSGNFSKFPVDQITVDRDVRQRRKLENIDELAGSIKGIGLINPILIKKSGKLVVGERRLEAVKKLGWEEISVQFAEDLHRKGFAGLNCRKTSAGMNCPGGINAMPSANTTSS